VYLHPIYTLVYHKYIVDETIFLRIFHVLYGMIRSQMYLYHLYNILHMKFRQILYFLVQDIVYEQDM
jgi:hypothetical protein